MGSTRSGRWRQHTRATTVEAVPLTLQLDRTTAAAIRTGGAYHMRWRWWPDWPEPPQESTLLLQVVEHGRAVILQYQASGSEHEVTERVPVVTANLTYGQRLFWLCPGCDQRVGVLYSLGLFRCRHCHGLTYRSAQESDRRVYALARGAQPPAAPATNAGTPLQQARTLLLHLKARVIQLRRQQRDLRKLGIKEVIPW
jgi:hypothetical protein